MNPSETTTDTQDVTPTSAVAERTLRETDYIDLLCQQENLFAKLLDASSGSCTQDSLDIAKQSLLRYLDFVEAHFSSQEAAPLTSRLGDLHERVRQMEQTLACGSWRSLRKLVGARTSDPLEIASQHQQLGHAFVELHAEFFTFCLRRCNAPSTTKTQLLESLDAFVLDVTQRW